MDRYDNLRRAIDVMTAWVTDPEGRTGVTGQRVADYVGDGPDGEMQLMFGLVGLAGYLLVRLEDKTGQSMQSHLQDISLRTFGSE